MSVSRCLLILGLTFLGVASYSKGLKINRKPASVNEDGKVMNCTVSFRTKDGMTVFQTQKQAWQLSEKKGFIELKSIGDVEVSLSKESSGKTPTFTLSIKQGKLNLGELKTEHRAFMYATAVDVKIEDGEDGWKADQIQVACDATTMGE